MDCQKVRARRILAEAAIILSLLAVAVRAGAQTNEYDDEIADLRGLIQDFESKRTMIIADPPDPNAWAVIDRDRVDDIAGYLVISGQLDPRLVARWADEQLALSQGALALMKKQLVELEAKRLAPPPPPPSADWPAPMNWREVRGVVRGTYSIQCSNDGSSLPPLRGTFTLELRGKGVVYGSFTDTGDRTVQEMNGDISDAGIGNGSARSINAITAWSARFVRVGNVLKVQNPQVTMVPFEEGARCDPGVIQQQ